jgi:molecular chaperone DnaK (HSP70)
MLDIEAVKRQLSSRMECDLVIRTATDRISIKLDREDLHDACSDLFASTAEIIERVLASAEAKGVSVIDEVIMVGGSSRIPSLAAALQERLSLVPRLIDPDLAVAKGAALRAHQIVNSSQLRTLGQARGFLPTAGHGAITPVLPRAVGLLVDDSHDPDGQRQFVAHLLHANTALPTSRSTTDYGTILPKQDSVRIQIYEQAGSSPSHEVEHNHRVLDGELTGLGELPAGSVLEITIKVAIDGRLTLIAREPISGRELTLEAFVEGVVDSAEVEELTKTVGLLAVRG